MNIEYSTNNTKVEIGYLRSCNTCWLAIQHVIRLKWLILKLLQYKHKNTVLVLYKHLGK